MIFEVTAISIQPTTGEVQVTSHTDAKGRITERIDTEDNVLFKDCHSEWEVEDCYGAFWNRLNAHWEIGFPGHKDKVLVLTVRRVKAF